MTEEWRPVSGFEGYYEVSDLGNVRGVDRVIRGRRRGGPLVAVANAQGYARITLRRDGHKSSVSVHRLVAEALWFYAHVDKTNDCWLWTGSKYPNGYGRFNSGYEVHLAHRWSYEHSLGEVPDGAVLDHLCRVRHCVRPDHLEPVTQQENLLRGEGVAAKNAAKSTCPNGHPYDSKRGHARACSICDAERRKSDAYRELAKERYRRYRARKKERDNAEGVES